MPSLALAHSEEISTASSGVSFLLKMLIFCEVPILATPLLEHHMLGHHHSRYKHPLAGTPLSVPAPSEKVWTASSGVSLLHKVLIFCAMLILVTPLLEHHVRGYPPLQVQAPRPVHLSPLPATNKQKISLAHITWRTLKIKRTENREPSHYNSHKITTPTRGALLVNFEEEARAPALAPTTQMHITDEF